MWLLACLVLTVAFSFSPFEGSIAVPELRERIDESSAVSFTKWGADSIGHFGLFFLLGGLIAAARGRELEDWPFSRVALVAIAACAAFESIQFLLPARHARVDDLALHILGLLLGLWCSTRWKMGLRWRLAIQEWCRRRPSMAAASLVVIGLAVWWGPMLRPAVAGPRLDWKDPDSPLVIGNERFGMRPWLGEIRYAGVYGRALNDGEVMKRWQTLESGPDPVAAGESGLLVGYDFRLGPVDVMVPEGELGSMDFAMEIPRGCAWVSGGGMRITEPVILLSRGPAYDLTGALTSSGAFSVEAWVQPSNLTQTGPARILSVSPGIYRRSFTLAQSGDAVVFRVRNEVNGPNGSRYALTAKGMEAGAPQHWVAVYDRGVSKIYRNGLRMAETRDQRDPDFHLPFGAGAGGRAVGMVVLVVTIALPAAVLLGSFVTGWLAHGIALLFSIFVSVAPQILFALFSEARPHLSLETVLLQAAMILAAYPLILRCATPVEG